MSAQADDDTTLITIPVDGETLRRLVKIADMSHAAPKAVAASLLHDILKDDEDAHLLELMPAAGRA